MAAAIDKFNDIDEVKFSITLNVKDLVHYDPFRTKTFYVRGNPWSIEFDKICSVRPSLGLLLFSETEFENENVSVVANLKTKIISTKFNQKSHTFSTEPYAFYLHSSSWGDDNLISWAELMDPEKGYVHNDTCKIIVKVKASPLLNDINNGFLDFVTLKKSCNISWIGAFQIKINRIYDFFNICTPIFVLNDFKWRILVSNSKNEANQGGAGEGEDFLRIGLFNVSVEDDNGISCHAKIICKLVSYDQQIEPIRKSSEIKEFQLLSSSVMMDMISWNELLNPENKIVEDGSFILRVKIKVSEAKDQK